MIGILTDRHVILPALERMTAGHYICEPLTEASLGTLLQREPANRPSVVIVDVHVDLSRTIHAAQKCLLGIPMVVWQRSTASESSLNALEWGARGVLSDCSATADVLACLRAVETGSLWVPATVAQAVLSTRRCHLTPREGQLMKLVAQGLRNKEIAYALGISEGTVKVYVSRLFDKLEVSDRYELAMLALRHCGYDGSSPNETKAPGKGTVSPSLDAVYIARSVGPRGVTASTLPSHYVA